MFQLTAERLARLCAINHFPVPDDGMVFFGLRGCLPADPDDHAFAAERRLIPTPVDYTTPRCTLGQWLPAEGRIAVYPGSTVPHRRYVQSALERGGEGANQLLSGFYPDYRKGQHKAGSPGAHDAFRQTRGRPVRRSGDDLDFEPDDRVEIENAYDNLHAAWCMGIEHAYYASAGCQVVVGYPCCAGRNGQPDSGPWAHFRAAAYSLEQDTFPYVLLSARAAESLAAAGDDAPRSARLRYGSKGALVRTLQEALAERGHFHGNIDGDFGPLTLEAVLAFQTAAFGPDADDGIVGPVTAAALDIDWPNV
ncbi:MAG TPA: peptidoglycan-binding domain-containing protein [Longimicrobiales bacterium]